MIPTIYIGFVLLDALLLWTLIATRGRWALKVATIIIVLGFNFAVWNSLDSFRGWPTTATPPANAVFVQGVVNEPNPQTNDPGSIYLWLIPLSSHNGTLGYQSSGNEPRAYRLPYSEALYKQVLQAQQLLRRGHGRPVIVHGHGQAHGRGGRRGPHGNGPPSYGMHSYILPPSKPPRKQGAH